MATYSGEITLVSVADGGGGETLYTWIAYADSNTGQGISLSPTGKDYMGIAYNKEVEEPSIDDPSEYTWSKIKGESGEGADRYDVITNQEKIYKFYNNNSLVVFSPEELSIRLFKNNGETPLPISQYSFEIKVIGLNESLNDFYSLLGRLEKTNSICPSMTGNVGYQLNINALANDSYRDPSTEDELIYNALINGINSNNIYFIFEFFVNNLLVTTKAIAIEFGTSEDMAKFSLTEAAITTSIQNSKMQFDANGLTILNGGIEIQNSEGKTVLNFESENQILHIEGNGEFTGTIHATDGEFTGTVNAEHLTVVDGEIGGFNIGNGVLTSITNGIELNGSEGKIYAKNIELGTGAKISDYIEFDSNTFIYNPEEHEGLFIKSETIELNNNGTLKLGEIIANGNTSTLRGSGWSITPETATFSNIIAQGGTIENIVFKNSTTQAVGGLMIFKPSANISYVGPGEETGEFEFKFENRSPSSIFNVNDFVILSDGIDKLQYQIISKNESGFIAKFIDETNFSDMTKINVVIQLASYDGENLDNNLLIGLNPNSIGGDSKTDWELFQSGITFSAAKIITDDNSNTKLAYNSKPNLFLGNLNAIGESGFGLYGDNVFLKGTLSTAINNNSYAGVNTLTGTLSTRFGSDDERIVFWAGAQDNEDSAIQLAPFQVTEKGNLYAKSGVFEGSIITNSTISGSDIYVARIHGGTETSVAALTIYDTNQGIIFKQGFNGDEIETLRINGSGLAINEDNEFLLFNGNNVLLNAFSVTSNIIKTVENSNDIYIQLSENKLNFLNKDSESDIVKASILFDNNKLKFNFENEILSLSSTEADFKNNCKIENTVTFGTTDSNYMQYQKTNGGYDLYVY